eukprot:356533-Chlamydomonas_euryale.AAC.3
MEAAKVWGCVRPEGRHGSSHRGMRAPRSMRGMRGMRAPRGMRGMRGMRAPRSMRGMRGMRAPRSMRGMRGMRPGSDGTKHAQPPAGTSHHLPQACATLPRGLAPCATVATSNCQQ